MEPNEPLLATAGFIAAVVVTLVDGRNAVAYASLAAALGLMPSVVIFYGADAALVLGTAAVALSVNGADSRHLIGPPAGDTYLDPFGSFDYVIVGDDRPGGVSYEPRAR